MTVENGRVVEVDWGNGGLKGNLLSEIGELDGNCTAGTYSALASYESCNYCEAGKFSDEPNTEVCKICAADFNTHTTSASGSTSCTCKETFVSTPLDPFTNKPGCTCEPGYTEENGVCVQCQSGFFKTTYGTEACSSCDKYSVKGSIQTR